MVNPALPRRVNSRLTQRSRGSGTVLSTDMEVQCHVPPVNVALGAGRIY